MRKHINAPGSPERLELLASAIECAGDGIVIVELDPSDFKKRHVAYVNPALCKDTGYSAEEFYKAKTTYITHGPKTDKKAVDAFRDDLMAGRPGRAELEIYRKDGTTYWIEIEGRLIAGSTKNRVRWVIVERDITDRKKSLAQLAMLSAAIESATDFIFITDADDRYGAPAMQYVNAGMLRETGYALEELVGRNAAIFFGPETDSAVIGSLRQAIKEHQTASAVFLAYRKDGTSLWVEFNGRPVFDVDGSCTHWVAVGRDITERRRDLERLSLLTEAMSSATDSIIVYEVGAENSRPKILFVNEATVEQSGFSREELLSGSTGTGPETDKKAVAKIREDLREGRSVRSRLRLYRKEGSAYWGDVSVRPILDAAGKMTHWISIERDITELIEREKELESERDLLTGLVTLSRELFASLDGPSLLAAFTEALQRLFGFNVRQVDAAAARGRSEQSRETTILVPAGLGCGNIALQIEGSGDIFPTSQRHFALQLIAQTFYAAARNVSLYREVQDRRSSLMETNQSKNDLIAMLGHDFRGPLTSILGFAELLQDEKEGDSQAQFALRSIADSARQLESLANDTLAMARVERNELQLTLAPLDLRQLVVDVAESLRGSPRIVISCEHARVPIVGDAARLRQVFANLIDNAVKFSPGSLPVTVRIDSDSKGATVEVTDRGIGVPAEEIEAVFSRFTRGSNARHAGISGTGFGLFLVRSIVAGHGGNVSLRSEVGSTTFTVSLPRGATARPSHAGRLILLDAGGEAASSTALELRHQGFAVGVYDSQLGFEAALESVAFDAALVEDDAVQPSELARMNAACKRSKRKLVVIQRPLLSADLIELVERALV